MRVDILTLFPGIFSSPLEESLMKKARDRGLLNVCIHNIRDWTADKHKTADDRSFGGGVGMVMKAEPIFKAVEEIKKASRPKRIIIMCPQGEVLTHRKAQEISKEKNILIICGRYEGIDERVSENLVTDQISIGDYVLSGGELPALVLLEAVARFIPEVVGEKGSVEEDSFYSGLLDYPHYTRPEDFRGMKVPQVLLSGNHAGISRWRRCEMLRRTFFRRPDLLGQATLTEEDKAILTGIIKGQ